GGRRDDWARWRRRIWRKSVKSLCSVSTSSCLTFSSIAMCAPRFATRRDYSSVPRLVLCAASVSALYKLASLGVRKMARSTDYIGATGIGVSDLKRSAGFYVRALGMQEMHKISIDYMDEIILGHEGRNAVVLMHYTDGSK